MYLSRSFLTAAIALLCGAAFLTSQRRAQEPGTRKTDREDDRVSLFDSVPETTSESSVRRSRMSVAELRQARALYRANQRVSRIEYNLWLGHEPLRPRWNAVPMMSSRYSNYKYYVPVYYYPR